MIDKARAAWPLLTLSPPETEVERELRLGREALRRRTKEAPPATDKDTA